MWDEKCLQILAAMEKIGQAKKSKRTASQNEEDQTLTDPELAPSALGNPQTPVILFNLSLYNNALEISCI